VTIVVGYAPTPTGRGALVAAAGVAAERNRRSSSSTPPAGTHWPTPALPRRPTWSPCWRKSKPSRASSGSDTRTAIGKMLMGSNAHRILMDAACPVLAVKALDHG
jgi:hypothetical protein